MESRIAPIQKQEGEVVMISLANKKASDQLHQIEQKRIRELEHENAWLKLQLKKALAPDDMEIEIANGCMVLR